MKRSLLCSASKKTLGIFIACMVLMLSFSANFSLTVNANAPQVSHELFSPLWEEVVVTILPHHESIEVLLAEVEFSSLWENDGGIMDWLGDILWLIGPFVLFDNPDIYGLSLADIDWVAVKDLLSAEQIVYFARDVIEGLDMEAIESFIMDYGLLDTAGLIIGYGLLEMAELIMGYGLLEMVELIIGHGHDLDSIDGLTASIDLEAALAMFEDGLDWIMGTPVNG